MLDEMHSLSPAATLIPTTSQQTQLFSEASKSDENIARLNVSHNIFGFIQQQKSIFTTSVTDLTTITCRCSVVVITSQRTQQLS